MTTLNDLLLTTYRLLEDVPRTDSITQDIPAGTSSQISLTVNDPSQWPVQSRNEVHNELFLVTANNGTNPITVQRAYESTTQEPHKNGDQSRGDPRFLRQNIVDAINVALVSWCSTYFPKLVWDTTTGGVYTPINWVIPAPDDAMGIRRVTWQPPGRNQFVDLPHSNLQVIPATGLTNVPQSTTEPAGMGQGFELYGEMGLPGTKVVVLYEKRWPKLVNDTDVLDVQFPQDALELIPQGAILYIAGNRQTPRYRMDEVLWYREQNSPLPANFNQQWLIRIAEDWYRRARQVQGRRQSEGNPGMIWIGAIR